MSKIHFKGGLLFSCNFLPETGKNWNKNTRLRSRISCVLMWKGVFWGALLLGHFLSQREGISRELVFRVSMANRKHNSDLTHTHGSKHSPLDKSHYIKLRKWGSDLSWNQRFHHLLRPAELHNHPHNTKSFREREKRRWKCEGGRADSSWGMLTCAPRCSSQFWGVHVCVFYISGRQGGLMKSAPLVWHPLHTERATCAKKKKKSWKSCLFSRQRFKQGAQQKDGIANRLNRQKQLFRWFI